MRSAFDDALVGGWEPLEGTFGLPDADDEHVVAAAVVGGAGAIVTNNLRDFPVGRIPDGIKVLSPAKFAADTVAVSPDLAIQALGAIASRRRTPPGCAEQVMRRLVERYGCPRLSNLCAAISNGVESYVDISYGHPEASYA